ncbi:hypothetical protein ABC345_21035 [Shouchella sp. 1P09AA]|uniref:hypothetical protein n=1 Tax=unclassified Shouchella TaxID=2893065 RepID=UPI0039A14A86
MRRRKFFIPLLMIVGVLNACGNQETVQEIEGYEEFRDTVNNEDFSGFVYLLRNIDAHEGSHMQVIENTFSDVDETLTHSNWQYYDDTEKDMQNNDSRDSDIQPRNDKIIYIENGRNVSEFDINNRRIEDNEYQMELRQFIEINQ